MYGTPHCGSHISSVSSKSSRTSSVIWNFPVWSVVASSYPNHGPTCSTIYPASVYLVPWLLDGLCSHVCRTIWFLEEPLSLKPRTCPHREVTEAHTIGIALALRKRAQESQWKMIKKPLETVCGRGAGSLNFISCSVNLPLNRTPFIPGGPAVKGFWLVFWEAHPFSQYLRLVFFENLRT